MNLCFGSAIEFELHTGRKFRDDKDTLHEREVVSSADPLAVTEGEVRTFGYQPATFGGEPAWIKSFRNGKEAFVAMNDPGTDHEKGAWFNLLSVEHE